MRRAFAWLFERARTDALALKEAPPGFAPATGDRSTSHADEERLGSRVQPKRRAGISSGNRGRFPGDCVAAVADRGGSAWKTLAELGACPDERGQRPRLQAPPPGNLPRYFVRS